MPFPFISEERLANSVDTKFNTTNKICCVVLRRNGVYGNMVLPSCGQYGTKSFACSPYCGAITNIDY